MSCNCNNIFPDESMNRWETSCSVPYYTKAEIDEKLENIDISGDCMSSGDVQSMIDASVSPIEGSVEALSGSVVQLSTDMENKADRSEIPSLSGYATESWVNNKGYAYQSDVQALDWDKQDRLMFYEESTSPDFGKIEVYHNIIEVKPDGLYLHTNPEDENANAFLNDSPIQTEDTVWNLINEYTVRGDLSRWGEGDGEWNNEGKIIFPVQDDMPMHNTEPHLVYNVTRYSGDTPDEIVISPSVNDAYHQAKDGIGILRGFEVEGYQKTLSAGTGIDITNNVISCTVTGGGGGDMSNYYTKGETDNLLDDKLDASAYTPSDLSQYWTSAQTQSAINAATQGKADASNTYTKTEVNNIVNNKFVCITQAQYDALATKQPDTLYLIYEV